MKRDHSPLPIKTEGNGANLRTLTFDFADAPMLFAGMRLAANTVMMSGHEREKAERRLRHYQQMFLEACPPGFANFKREEDIATIAIEMMDADLCTIQSIYEYSWDKDVWLSVTIGDKNCIAGRVLRTDVPAMIDCLREIAPLSCRVETLDDVQGNPYQIAG